MPSAPALLSRQHDLIEHEGRLVRYLPCDLEAAAVVVDQSLRGASPEYIALHRDKAIRAEARFCRFERERQEKQMRALAGKAGRKELSNAA